MFLPRSFLTKTPSCSKSPDFQSLKSPCSIVSLVVICQQSSVWSVKRTLRYNRPSSNVCSTQSTTLPHRPGYLRPGSKLSSLEGDVLCFFTKLFQRSMVDPQKEWEVVQTVDTVTP